MPTTDPRIDAYIANTAPFAQPILSHLRSLVHQACPQVQETLKWSMPFFMVGSRNLCFMAGFKQHAGFGFWQGKQVVGEHSPATAMGQFGRLTTVADLPGDAELMALIQRAASLEPAKAEPAAKKAPARKAPLPVPDDLADALAKAPAAKVTFEALPPSQQREYLEWITGAKREETRQRRLAQALEWLAEGKPYNWQYR
jgi:uncharacterized protein YdeI (YjbR/CyaY-like superfamily)